MPQVIVCQRPGCGQKLRIPDRFADYEITCPACRHRFLHAETPEARARRAGGTQAFTHEDIAAALRAHQETLFAAVREDVRAALLATTPADALTFRLMKGDQAVRTMAPAASLGYAKVLIAFCRGQPFEGHALDSAITPIVMATVERTLLAFFASEGVARAVTDAVTRQFSQAAAAEVQGDAAWAQREIQTLLHYGTADSIALQVINLAADQVQHFLASSVGKQLVLALGKMMATAAGKAFLLRTLQVAIGKVMASVALKAAIVSLLRKVGIGILIKSAVGKALVAVLAMLGLAHVPVFWVLVPLLAAFMAYEYTHFPEKLAAKLPGEVETIIREQFLEVSENAAKEIWKGVVAEVVKHITKVHFGPEGDATAGS